MNWDEMREKLAEFEHERWTNWMNYQSSHATLTSEERHPASGELYTERWERLAKTPYSELTEQERQSDREIADWIIGILQEKSDEERQQQWIRTTPESLPESGRDVLAWWPGFCGVARRASDGQWWDGVGQGSPCNQPLYWMPLPREPILTIDLDQAHSWIQRLCMRLRNGETTYTAGIHQLIGWLETIVKLYERVRE